MVTAPWNQKTIASQQKTSDKPIQCVERQRHYSADKGPYRQGYGLPSGHIWWWELDCKEGRAPKNWHLQTVVLEKTPESPLTVRRSKQSILREINPEYSLEGLMLNLKLQYFGHLMWTADSLEKPLMPGKDWGQKVKRVSEDEMAGWHHWCNEHELRQTSGHGQEQGGLACYNPWGLKVLDMTGQLINNKGARRGIPWWFSGKESTCRFRRCGFHLWVRKIPWRRKWQPTPVFLPGKSQG